MVVLGGGAVSYERGAPVIAARYRANEIDNLISEHTRICP
jgi:hypothetical protein